MICRATLAAFASLVLSACDALNTGAADLAPQPAPQWATSGGCIEQYRCAAGGISDQMLSTSCPQTVHMWCREGAACNPNDTTPCVRSNETHEERAQHCSEPQHNFAFVSYDVLTCAPTGTWRPATAP